MGSAAYREEFVKGHVAKWEAGMENLVRFARSYPHEAYAVLVRSMIPRWRYVMRTMEAAAGLFEPLEQRLKGDFFPAALGWEPTPEERERCALPLRHGGLALPRPEDMLEAERQLVKVRGQALQRAILLQDWNFKLDMKKMREEMEKHRKAADAQLGERATEMLGGLRGRARRGFAEAIAVGSRCWLSAVPLQSMGWCLDRLTFRDAVALRVGVGLPDGLSETCPRYERGARRSWTSAVGRPSHTCCSASGGGR